MQPTALVGIPRALLYHEYGPVWEDFWQALGTPIRLSPPTNTTVLDQGTTLAVDESCLPLKIYLGHVHALLGRCTHLFIPRLVCLRPGGHYYCAKLTGLPDIVANTFPGAATLLVPVVDAERPLANIEALMACRPVGITPGRAYLAYRQALLAHRRRRQRHAVVAAAASRPVVALVGHSYLVHDPILGGVVADTLTQCGATVRTTRDLPPDALAAAARTWEKQVYWRLSAHMAGAVHCFARQPDVDGVMLLSSFGCGPDALVNEFLVRRILQPHGKPYFILTVDEHTGTAGLATRIEAFVDLVKRRGRQ